MSAGGPRHSAPSSGRDVYRGPHAGGWRDGEPARPSGRDRLRAVKRWLASQEVLYRGSAMQCPVCERHYRRFRSQGGRRGALCPNPTCMTVERHRLMWLLLTGDLQIAQRPTRLLHVAPEPGMARRLRALPAVRYTSVDLESPFADVHADLCALPFDAGVYDLVICSHVMEHVPRDGAALAEIRRVLAPGGTAVLMYPIDHRRADTDEDPAVTDPHERRRRFGQFDHVRLYGRDHLSRLRQAGFTVTVRDVASELDSADARRYGLAQLVGRAGADADGNTIFLCR